MISVIIPVYNVEEYLHICINSILKQTYKDFEIICIDDASTDSSLEIVEYFAKKDSRVKVIKNEKNRGLGPSRNVGMNAAQGKYIIFLDSDDWYSFDTLEKLYNESEKNSLDVLMFKNIAYYEESRDFGFEPYYDMEFMNKFDHKVFNHWDLDKTRFFSVPIGACNKLYLKSFLDEHNIRFTNKNYIHEDNPFSTEVLLKAERVSFISEYFYNRRRRSNSITAFNNERLFDNIPIVHMVLNVFLEDREIYEYYKKEVLDYVFRIVLMGKYNQIDDQYKEEFYIRAQGVFKSFISDYGLYKDIKENVDNEVLDFFNFEDIVEELVVNNSNENQ